MTYFNLITEVEGAVEEIAISRAVLERATQFFDSTKEEDRAMLPYYAETIHKPSLPQTSFCAIWLTI